MTDLQFHSIVGPIWLVASNTETNPWMALAFAAAFVYHVGAAALAMYRESRRGR